MDRRDQKGRFQPATKAGPGRASKYQPSMNERAYRLARLGLTEAQIAFVFGTSRNTLHRWKARHPGFRDAIQRGKKSADAQVAYALFQRATGMRVMTEKAMLGPDGEVIIVETFEELPPDTGAAIHWLAMRQRRAWRTR